MTLMFILSGFRFSMEISKWKFEQEVKKKIYKIYTNSVCKFFFESLKMNSMRILLPTCACMCVFVCVLSILVSCTTLVQHGRNADGYYTTSTRLMVIKGWVGVLALMWKTKHTRAGKDKISLVRMVTGRQPYDSPVLSLMDGWAQQSKQKIQLLCSSTNIVVLDKQLGSHHQVRNVSLRIRRIC